MVLSGSQYIEGLARGSTSGSFPIEEKGAHPKLLVMLLNNIAKSQVENKDAIRISFVVLKVLTGGYSSANINIEKLQKAQKDRGGAGAGKRTEKVAASDYLYNLTGNGVLLAKSYVNINKGVRGAPSEKSFCIVPGMVLEGQVWREKDGSMSYEGTMGPTADFQDMPIFSQCIVCMQSRSLTAKGAKIQIANTAGKGPDGISKLPSVRLWKAPLVFGARHLVSLDSLFPRTVADSTARRLQFLDSEAYTTSTGSPVDQEHVQDILAQTRHVLCIRPEAKQADVGRNADGTLYMKLFDAPSLVGFDVSRIRLHDSVDGHMDSLGTGEWNENLLRFAISRKALTVLVTYDSMRQVPLFCSIDLLFPSSMESLTMRCEKGMQGDEEQIVDGVCILSLSDMLSMCIQSTPIDPATLTTEQKAAFFTGTTTQDDFDVFADDNDNDDHDAAPDSTDADGDDADDKVPEPQIRVVVSKAVRKNVPPPKDEDSGVVWRPPICHPKATSLWEEGRIVRVFDHTKIILFFVASGTCVVQECGSKRRFNEMDDSCIEDLV
jgi:hypothetical protein